MSFTKVAIDEVRIRAGRRGKTGPLRDQIVALAMGEALYVPFYDPDANIGYKPSTVAQLAGLLSRHGEYRYSVCRDNTSDGCFIVCKDKALDGKKRGPKPKSLTPTST
jgi:hypothetical protein